MTRQQMFTAALEGIRSQGCASVDKSGLCMYRGPGGLKCAVGWLIPDEDYQWSFEVLPTPGVPLTTVLPWVEGETLRLAGQLQAMHDTASEFGPADFLPRYEEFMAALAEREGLTYTPPGGAL